MNNPQTTLATINCKVLMNRQDYVEPILEQCRAVAKEGGSWEVENVWTEGSWFSLFKIYPSGVSGSCQNQ